MPKIEPFYKSTDKAFTLLSGDCREILSHFEFTFDMIFADPPYFLSNGGITFQNGQIACVDKGEWDKSYGMDFIDTFNKSWLEECRKKLKPGGTIWISSTHHNLFSVGRLLNQLDFKILNIITWVKKNPPPNVSCHYFTHSAEYIIWARYSKDIPHYYNYDLMRRLNNNEQMPDVWHLSAIEQWEKSCGKHPTQKPLTLLARTIMACTRPGYWVLDPFTGSSTTGIAANLLGRHFLGIDINQEYLELSKCRKLEIEHPDIFHHYCHNLAIE